MAMSNATLNRLHHEATLIGYPVCCTALCGTSASVLGLCHTIVTPDKGIQFAFSNLTSFTVNRVSPIL